MKGNTLSVLLHHRTESELQLKCDDKVWLELVQ